ncbi:hypothetical protein A2U01_0058229, partial [Trifolium medium]|nr:hypothetical protein [Trifolium medium]
MPWDMKTGDATSKPKPA